jgi:hypothetical protein
MVVRLRTRVAERCALCHDALEGEATIVCAGCGTEAHEACASELGRRCPTLGCDRPRPLGPRPATIAARDERPAPPVGRGWLLVTAWSVGFACALVPTLIWIHGAQLL